MAEIGMLVTTNFNRTIKSFYMEVLGWTWSASGDGWVSYNEGDGKGGLICAPIAGGDLAGWYPCHEVDDVNETLGKVTSQGGTVVLGKNDFPNGNGSYAIFKDPQGACMVIREID